jgi:DNA-binding NtrC family response regulator
LLAHGLLQKCLTAQQKHVEGISDSALARFIDYPWPGNVRELENIVERAATLTQGQKVSLEDLPLNIQNIQGEGQFIEDAVEQTLPLAQVEQSYIRRVLEKLGGNKYQTAQVLGIDRKTLYRKLSEMEDAKSYL